MGVRFEQFFIERPQSGRKFDVRKFWQVRPHHQPFGHCRQIEFLCPSS